MPQFFIDQHLITPQSKKTMAIETIGLEEAAALLQMTPEGVRRKAAAGKMPGSKPGKRWCFIDRNPPSN